MYAKEFVICVYVELSDLPFWLRTIIMDSNHFIHL